MKSRRPCNKRIRKGQDQEEMQKLVAWEDTCLRLFRPSLAHGQHIIDEIGQPVRERRPHDVVIDRSIAVNQDVSEVDRCRRVADAPERRRITFPKPRERFTDDLEFPLEDDLEILLGEVLIS